MKITDIKTYLVNANATNTSANPRGRLWLFVKIYTDEGITGVGEGGSWSWLTEKAVQEYKPFLIGEDPFDIERLWYKLHLAMYEGAGFYQMGTLQGGVLSGIDIALWDIKGKALGRPVYDLLGGKFRNRIEVYGHASTPETAQKLIERGYKAFKCRPSVKVIKELRETVGYDVGIGLHGHCEFTPREAIHIGRMSERYEPMFFEEPVPCENTDDLAKVASALDIPIATGERIYSKWGFTELLNKKIVDIVQPEILCLGGITEEKKLAILAESNHVLVAPHDGSSGPIQEVANLHLLASIPNFFMLEHRATDVPWRNEVVKGLPIERNGYIDVPDKPGLGIELDEEEIAKHPVPEHEEMTYRAAMEVGRKLWPSLRKDSVF